MPKPLPKSLKTFCKELNLIYAGSMTMCPQPNFLGSCIPCMIHPLNKWSLTETTRLRLRTMCTHRPRDSSPTACDAPLYDARSVPFCDTCTFGAGYTFSRLVYVSSMRHFRFFFAQIKLLLRLWTRFYKKI